MPQHMCTKVNWALEWATQKGDAVSTLGGFLNKYFKSLGHLGLPACSEGFSRDLLKSLPA